MIARARNSVVFERDATAHAEMNALRAIAGTSPERLALATLYASTEPCVMCSGAIYWAGIGRVVYGCSAEALAHLAGERLVVPCRTIFVRSARPIDVIGPLLEDEATTVHHSFWR